MNPKIMTHMRLTKVTTKKLSSVLGVVELDVEFGHMVIFELEAEVSLPVPVTEAAIHSGKATVPPTCKHVRIIRTCTFLVL